MAKRYSTLSESAKEEFNKLPKLGPTAICIKCGLEHKIIFVKSGDYMFGIINCCDITWLVGLDGKDLQTRDVSKDDHHYKSDEIRIFVVRSDVEDLIKGAGK